MVAITILATLGLSATLPVNGLALPRDDTAAPTINGTAIYYQVYRPDMEPASNIRRDMLPEDRRDMLAPTGIPCGNGDADKWMDRGMMCCSPDSSWPPLYCYHYDKCVSGPFRRENGEIVWACQPQAH